MQLLLYTRFCFPNPYKSPMLELLDAQVLRRDCVPAGKGPLRGSFTAINKNARATLSSIRQMIQKNKYRPDLRMAAIRRASAILLNQKPVVVKRKRTRPTKSS
uniref:LRRGT00107 n=1 Tax=Rattus norvegicus TaxID=10116 RepID=Q6TUD7_RAT|nr:LRRGT00107 [Rattus norvegicus]|eukprot:NP_001257317.1 uncharacterized protein LOC100360619 [Rattus norvegicus]